ncbi:hemerythrin domain-containing protein [Chloroflexota bacterium]
MEEVIAIIDKIIEEHNTIFQEFQTLEQMANDAEAIIELDKAKEKFMPGRFGAKEGLKEFEILLDKIDQGIQAHFDREEGVLFTAFEKSGDRNLVSSLHSLLTEHKTLTDRLVNSKQDVEKLTSGNLSRDIWESTGYDMRAYLTHTRTLFQEHARMEQELFCKLRS